MQVKNAIYFLSSPHWWFPHGSVHICMKFIVFFSDSKYNFKCAISGVPSKNSSCSGDVGCISLFPRCPSDPSIHWVPELTYSDGIGSFPHSYKYHWLLLRLCCPTVLLCQYLSWLPTASLCEGMENTVSLLSDVTLLFSKGKREFDVCTCAGGITVLNTR